MDALVSRHAFEQGVVGIFPDMPEETYFASPGISQSDLKLLGEEGGPAKLRYGERRETQPLKLGSLTHTALLQPYLLTSRYHVTQLLRDGTKEWMKEKLEVANGRLMIKQAEFDKARYIADAVMRWSSVARELLTDHDRISVENSFFWIDEESGLLCRARADILNNDYDVIVDIKTARSASTEGFSRAVRDYKYNLQAAHYIDGLPLAGGWKPVDFIFIVVETECPFLTKSYVLSKERIDEGRAELRRLIGIYQECDRTDNWYGYAEGVETL